MTAEQFSYWLQGYLEISGATELNSQQLKIVQDHLQLVFKKVTPNYQGILGGTTITLESGSPMQQGGNQYSGYSLLPFVC